MALRFHQIFRAAVFIKGLDGCVETLAGCLLGVMGPERVNQVLLHLANHALSRSTAHFSDFYLVSHGLVKLLLAVGLLAEQTWTYAAGFWVLLGLVIYQLARFSNTRSWVLLAFTLYDAGVVALLVREIWIQRRAAIGTAPMAPALPSKK
jgi:uncharacterized membrane protein